MKVYATRDEYTAILHSMYQDIKTCVDNCIVTNTLEYHYMSDMGLTSNQECLIRYCLENNLFKLTDDKQWSENIAYHIVYGILGFFNGMINTGIWKKMYEELEPEKVSDMICENIIFQFDNYNHWPCYLDDVIQITDEIVYDDLNW